MRGSHCVCVCGSHLRFLLFPNRGTRVHLCMSRASAVGVARRYL